MPELTPNNVSNWKRFFTSPHHAWLAALTLGLGFISANPFLFAVGVGAYLLGWIYLPDSAWFQNWIQKGQDAVAAAASRQQAQAFLIKRDGLLHSLSLDKTRRYYEIAEICKDIERASRDSADGVAQSALHSSNFKIG